MLSRNGQQPELKVKVIFDTDIRQWRYPSTKRYESLRAFVQTSFRTNNFLLQYTDDEGDRLTIASETDIMDAYNVCKEQCRRSLRVFVTEQISFHTNPSQNIKEKESDTEPIEFHWGTTCTHCKTSPIQGPRYKCCICSSYDLCSKCESIKDIHDTSHPFIKLNIHKNKLSRFGVSVNNLMLAGLNEILTNLGLMIAATSSSSSPTQRTAQKGKTVKRRFENKNKSVLSAELIEDLTLKEEREYIMDSIERKRWRLRNNGTTEWGYNAELVFVKGYEGMVLNKRISVSNCKPNKVTDIQCSIKIPNKVGRYIVYYRLHSDNVAFGPILSADIIAKQQHKEVEEDNNNNSSIVFDDNNNNKKKGRRLSMILSSSIPSINCICGEYLMVTRPSAIYGSGQIIFCIECGSRCISSDTIYHCSMDRNSIHPRGYDLCNKCYESRLVSAYNDNDNHKEKEEELQQVITEDDIMSYRSRISELRNVFPRFYFVSDAVMVELIRDPSPLNVAKYLDSLFFGLDGFVLDEDNDHIILGLRGLNGEILRFGRLINVDHKSLNGSLDKWLLKVEYQMRYSMSIKLEESFADYAIIENSDKYKEWINNYSTQIILITKKCLWCKTIEYFLNNKKNKNLNLNECLNEIKAEINLLSSYIKKELINDGSKSRIGALIQQLVYQRDVTSLLIKYSVSNTSDPIWVSKMRTYYLTDDNMLDQYNIFKKLYIKCNKKTYYYGYEFYGDVTSFIYTRTINTDTLFPHLLSTTIDSNQISNVYGDIGTGKTESIRCFAYDLGRPCKVFSDQRLFKDAQTLFNWFCGISSLGGYAILTQNVMTKFGGQISYFAASINYHLNEHKNHMIINEQRIPLHSNTRIFIVTKKRLQLNDIMNKIVKGIAMPSSNKLSITHSLLSANGFQNVEYLAKKIVMLLELCVTLLITENSYDFGFKLIMKIANKAGNALIDYIQNHPDLKQNDIIPLIDDENNNNNVPKNEFEEILLTNSLVQVMFNMLNHSDCILFESLMESAFPDNNIDWNKYTQIKQKENNRSQSSSSISSSNSLYTNNNLPIANNNYFKYNKELHHLIMMGFTNISKCKQMLIKHRGNTQFAMNELFAKSMV